MDDLSLKIQIKLKEINSVILKSKDSDHISLMQGNCGLSLFLMYYAKYQNKPQSLKKAISLIKNSYKNIPDCLNSLSFANGLAGFAWLLEHITQHRFIDINTSEILPDIDKLLHSFMLEELEKGNYDYLHHASGIAVYLLHRNSISKREDDLKNYITLLDNLAESDTNGKKWKSKNHTGEVVYNLGLSHGMASIIAILCKFIEKGIDKENTERLLKESINFVLYGQLDGLKNISVFPNWILPDKSKGSSSRLAWCYGDLGISVSLWNASRVLNDQKLEQQAIDILLHSARRRNLEENMVKDAGLCHGTAGIAHIFNRMYRNTGLTEFKETSEFWFHETLKMAYFKDGLAGFKVWKTEKYGGWLNEYGLLEGIAGIGLALLSYVSDDNAFWDECLLLS